MLADLQEYEKNLGREGKSPATAKAYRRDIEKFLTFMEKYDMSFKDVGPLTTLQFRDYLENQLGNKDNSIRRAIIGLRNFMEFMSRTNTVDRLTTSPIPSRKETPAPSLTESQVGRLIKAALDSSSRIKGLRDSAAISLLSFEGLKSTELIELSWSRILFSKSFVSLSITGDRRRIIHLFPTTEKRLRDYRSCLLENGIRHQRVFFGLQGRGEKQPTDKLSRHGLKFIITELAEKCDLDHINAETLRHHAVAYQLKSGKSPEEVMKSLGLNRLGIIGKHLGPEAPR